MRAVAPASIANVGPGFDTFGLCLAEPADRVEVWWAEEGLEVEPAGAVPTDPARNTAAVAARAALRRIGRDPAVDRIRIRVTKGVPVGKGIGSSAASAAGGALAVNALFGDPLPLEDVVLAAAEGEAATSGSAHPDNVAACLFGGFTIARPVPGGGTPGIRIDRLRPPPIALVVATPEVVFETRQARAVLPAAVPLADAVANIGAAGSFVAALARGDVVALGRAMTDRIAEPVRRPLVPGLDAALRAALGAGALGANIAGAGPSAFALVRDVREARATGEAMVNGFATASVRATWWIARPGEGARVDRRS